MSIPATIQTDVKYTSDGKSVYWPIPFPYASFADVGVKTISVDTGVEKTLTLGVDYQIQGERVVAVVPSGQMLEIWLTTSLDAVLANFPEHLPHPHGRPVGIPGPGGAVPPPPGPVPPLGNPWADRHLGVLSSEVLNLKRQLEEGVAIERARECDGQIKRIRDEGKKQGEAVAEQTRTELHNSLSSMSTTSQSYVDQLNAVGTSLTTTAHEVSASACEKQRAALATLEQLDVKNREVKADLVASESYATAAANSAAEAKHYRDEAVTAASDIDVAKATCQQYQAQMAADKQIVATDKAAVAEDRAAVAQMQVDAHSALSGAQAVQAEIGSHVQEAREAAASAQNVKEEVLSATERARQYADSASTSADAASASATQSAQNAANAANSATEARASATAASQSAANAADDEATVRASRAQIEAMERACVALRDQSQELANAANASQLSSAASAERAAVSATAAESAKEVAQAAEESVSAMKQDVEADKEATVAAKDIVVAIKDNAEQAIHDVAVDMLTDGVVQDAANAAAAAATTQAQTYANNAAESATAAQAARTGAEAAQTAAEAARDEAQSKASAAEEQATDRKSVV